MIQFQYNFFESKEQTEIRCMKEHIEKMEKSLDKQRKSLFARNGELNKKQLDLEQRLEAIERGLCQSA